MTKTQTDHPGEKMLADLKADCPKCHGKGWYSYSDNHGKPCEACCQHDRGWFPTAKKFHGREGFLCKAGCGEFRETIG